jgi:hypothetical protein
MKKNILTGALIQFVLSGVLGISLALFAGSEHAELVARLYVVCGILGTTGIFTGLVGAVYPNKQLVPIDAKVREV